MSDTWTMRTKIIIVSYKKGYVMIAKGCATSTIATIDQQDVPGAQYPTSPGKIFIYMQTLLPFRLINEGNRTVALIHALEPDI